MKLTTNFEVEEIVNANAISGLSDLQWKMLLNIGSILDKIMQFAGCKLIISSGMRTLADYERLKKAGYNPSDKSDHFYGIKPFTAGAVDLVPENPLCSPILLFNNLVSCYDKPSGFFKLPGNVFLDVGQIIYETDNKNRAWIHVSNPKKLFYSDPPIVTKILKSIDGGKTYQTI